VPRPGVDCLDVLPNRPRHRAPLLALLVLAASLAIAVLGSAGALAAKRPAASLSEARAVQAAGDGCQLTERRDLARRELERRVRRSIAAAPSPRLRRAARRRAERARVQASARARASAAPGRCGQHGAGDSSAPHDLYWGAWIGDQLTGEAAPWDMGAVSKFEGLTGKGLSLVNFAAPFADCTSSPCSFFRFPAKEMESIRAYGAVPVFSWTSDAFPVQLEQPDFQLSDVIEGRYDSYIREFAEEAKAWGHPFFLRFDWEMNADWFQWSEAVNGNQPGQYVAAWRHVHDIFTAVGATNANWVWCPYVDPNHRMQDLSSLYPGDEYVDWTGLDGYNWGTNPANPKGWRTFDQLFSTTYAEITEKIAPSKPLMIAEVGSSEYGGSKAAWIEEALRSASTEYPRLGGLIWFDNYADGMDWPLETSSSASSAFATGIAPGAYQANAFASLSGEKLLPPA
jgi:Glycosyl hydrolase family 26